MAEPAPPSRRRLDIKVQIDGGGRSFELHACWGKDRILTVDTNGICFPRDLMLALLLIETAQAAWKEHER